jgi:phosphatidylglycerophosphate synthase
MMRKEGKKDLRAKLLNALTLSRIVFGLIAVSFLLLDKPYWAVGFIIIGFLSDKLDGTLARWLKIQSKEGNLLDSVSDRIFQITIVLALIFLGKLPLFFIIFIGFWLVMELTLGILITRRLGKFYLFANHKWSAKITSFLGFLAFLSIILGSKMQLYFIYLLMASATWYMMGHINLLIKHKEKCLLE